jgi:hypothetical protein
MPNPPLLLVDNVFDAIGLYPGAVIDATSEAAGHEAFRVATIDAIARGGRRSMTAAGSITAFACSCRSMSPSIRCFSIAGTTSPGNRCSSKAARRRRGRVGQVNVPSAVGGTPAAPTMCQTEEGAAWSLFDPTAFRPLVEHSHPARDGFVPVVTGIILGLARSSSTSARRSTRTPAAARSRRSNRRRAIARTIARTAGAR